MEFLRVAKRRSLVSESVYILLNVGLAAAILIVVWAVESPLPAFALILLSKWRVLAVRPRYWAAHIQANMVDLVVSISLVVLLYSAGSTGSENGIIIQIILATLYALWLLILKPRTKRSFVVAQAGVALFVGVIALYSTAFEWPSSVVTLFMWLLGYSAARHVLSAYSEESLTFLSLAWGFVIAQLGWLAYHLTIAYDLSFIEGIRLPQIALIVVAISFAAERVYASYAKHGVVKSVEVLMPVLLTVSVVVILMSLFSAIAIGNI
jgi:hypothetical protein